MTTRRALDVIGEQELVAKGRAVVRVGSKQLAVFATERGVLACNNRCPHEGYPLAEGTLDDRCVLTCNWHNWKFELETGRNLYGGDALRTYPVEIRAGRVWVDVSDPPPELAVAERMARLHEAVTDDSTDRIAREVARLLGLGVTPERVLLDVVARRAEHLEFGFSHALAGLPDWLALADELPDEAERLACFVEPLAHIARDTLRQPARPFAPAAPQFDPALLAEAIEAEDQARAEGAVRAALAAGVSDDELAPLLARSALSHYADFGHSLIYLQKALEGIRRLGGDARWPLLGSLVRSLVYAQRDDLIPEFREYRPALERFGSGTAPLPTVTELLELGTADTLARVVDSSAAAPLALYRVLLDTAAARLSCFDTTWATRVDRPVSDNVGWLDFTHALTFGHAARSFATRQPELWPAALLQLACFTGRNRRYAPGPPPDAEPLAEASLDLAHLLPSILDHGLAEPIVSVHRLKTFVAVRRELQAGFADAAHVAALERFLSAPMKRRHVVRTARQALAFVRRED
ncbi:MAG: Rieske 2Fe-2S domain-containing protein [Polyangiaceae bacterium]|nr:Rieske 2Fe-2S domain-containing protein [Polyangiaceae bacterium]